MTTSTKGNPTDNAPAEPIGPVQGPAPLTTLSDWDLSPLPTNRIEIRRARLTVEQMKVADHIMVNFQGELTIKRDGKLPVRPASGWRDSKHYDETRTALIAWLIDHEWKPAETTTTSTDIATGKVFRVTGTYETVKRDGTPCGVTGGKIIIAKVGKKRGK